VIVGFHVALVVDLDQHILEPAFEQPVRRGIVRRNHRRLVLQSLILPEVEVADDDHHPKFIGPRDDAIEPFDKLGPQRAGLGEAGVIPRLIFGVTLRAAPCRFTVIANSPCCRHSGIAARNSRRLRSASQTLVSGYAQSSRVCGFKSSKVACTMRLLSSSPSIFFPFQVRPAYVAGR